MSDGGTSGSARTVALGALAYFGPVLAAGFVLGTIRTLWVVPRFGARAAELAELPFMVAISFVAAGWVVGRFGLAARSRAAALALGASALGLLVGAELALVLPVRQLTLAEYWRQRDPVSGAAYLGALAVFALLPWLRSGSRARG